MMARAKIRYKIIQDKDDPVVKRQRGALIVIVAAIILDVICGLIFASQQRVPWYLGLYWAEGEATTVGNSVVNASTPGSEVVKAIVGVTVIPLFAATFSIFTTALTATHVHRIERSITRHVTKEKDDIKNHISGGKRDG